MKKIFDKIKKFAFLKKYSYLFILDANCLEVLQLSSFCGQAARAIAGHKKQPHRPNVAYRPRIGQLCCRGRVESYESKSKRKKNTVHTTWYHLDVGKFTALEPHKIERELLKISNCY